MHQDSIDLSILIIFFIGLQAYWIIPIIKKNINLNSKERTLKEERDLLEKSLKK